MQLLGSDGNSRIFKINKRNTNYRYVLSLEKSFYFLDI